jgi:hypothetical protein
MFGKLQTQLETFGLEAIYTVKTRILEMNYGSVMEELSKMQRALADQLMQFRCEKSFYSLEPTGDDKVRYCLDCRKHVYKVESLIELEARSRAGQCTAVQFKFEDKFPEVRSECIITDFDDELMGLPF